MSREIVMQALKTFRKVAPVRGDLEATIVRRGLTSLEAQAAIQSGLDEGWLDEPFPGYVRKCGVLKRLWAARPWKEQPPTADDMLALMTPVAQLPPVDSTVNFGGPISVPCVLAELRGDGSLLEHREVAVYHFGRKAWVRYLANDKTIEFSATHYRIAVPSAGARVLHFPAKSSTSATI